jgi:quercetin dioxygenase-like cupin family protein
MNALLVAAVAFALAAAPDAPAPPVEVRTGDVIQLPPPAAIAITPDTVVWKPGPPSLPAGTQAAVLEGDPTKPGIVTMRLKLAKGFRLPMHTHAGEERVTVLSGTMRVTYVESANGAAAQTSTRIFPAGSFYVTPRGVVHAVAVDEETVMQVTVQGPWGLAYVDAKDDPRNKK